MPDLKTNVLYYGDNLEISRGYIPDGLVDLIYLDPPFNSQQQYNVLFKEPPTEPMRVEAATAGFHSSLLCERDFPRIQIFTVAELLEGKQPELPGRVPGFARAPRERERAKQGRF